MKRPDNDILRFWEALSEAHCPKTFPGIEDKELQKCDTLHEVLLDRVFELLSDEDRAWLEYDAAQHEAAHQEFLREVEAEKAKGGD